MENCEFERCSEALRPIPRLLHSIECEDLVFPEDSPFWLCFVLDISDLGPGMGRSKYYGVRERYVLDDGGQVAAS